MTLEQHSKTLSKIESKNHDSHPLLFFTNSQSESEWLDWYSSLISTGTSFRIRSEFAVSRFCFILSSRSMGVFQRFWGYKFNKRTQLAAPHKIASNPPNILFPSSSSEMCPQVHPPLHPPHPPPTKIVLGRQRRHSEHLAPVHKPWINPNPSLRSCTCIDACVHTFFQETKAKVEVWRPVGIYCGCKMMLVEKLVDGIWLVGWLVADPAK